MTLEPIDLRHGAATPIGVYVLETDDGLALYDCGPTVCIPTLKAGLAARGLALTDLRHLVLSHIHLDHAGAAGVLVREHPGLQVHVSEVGAPHVVDPSRLERSARRIYGELFDQLWGELAPVPQENVRPVGDVVLGLDCFATPGHASHHVSYLDGDGTLFAGDSFGIRIPGSGYVTPPTPPPDIDVETWLRTLDETLGRRPVRAALIHIGVHDDPERHVELLREELLRRSELVGRRLDQEAWAAAVRPALADAPQVNAEVFEESLVPDYNGLKRYWDKKRERENAAPASPG
jgi:glyoxylase-like metal-dependent hydrolase (beta-lactamase superfamily II)